MPKLSVVVSSNRPSYLPRFCDYLIKNSVEIELIIVGPSSIPDMPVLPITPRFISTNLMPASAWECGARAATGDFLALTCDDFCCSPGFYDDAIVLANAPNNNIFNTYSPRFVDDKGDQTHGVMLLGHPSMPFMPVGGIGFTEGHRKIGGIDKRFTATVWDCDLFHRMFVTGGRCTLLPGHYTREFSTGSTMFVRYSEPDKIVLKSLWYQGDKPTLVRNSPVQSYTDTELNV